MKLQHMIGWKYSKWLNETATNDWMKLQQMTEWHYRKWLNESTANDLMKLQQITERVNKNWLNETTRIQYKKASLTNYEIARHLLQDPFYKTLTARHFL